MSMQVFTQTLTLNHGTPATISDLASNGFKCTKLFIEQVQANTHLVYVGDPSLALGTSTVDHVIKQLQIPATAAAGSLPLDNFDVQDPKGGNAVDTTQYSFDGTTAEKVNITIWVF